MVFELDLEREDHREILDSSKRAIPDDMPITVLDGFAALVEAADDTRTTDEST